MDQELTGDIYNARLISIGSSTTGKHATAKLTVDGSGTITDVKVMDGGSAYGIGNTMNVVGVDYHWFILNKQLLKLIKFMITLEMLSELLVLSLILTNHIINFIELLMLRLDAATTVTVAAASSIAAGAIAGSATDTGIGVTLTDDAYFYLTGEAINVNTFTYTQNSGIATVTTTQSSWIGS